MKREREKLVAAAPDAGEVCVRGLLLEDLREVTLVHLAAFPDSALTKLGAESVRRYYEWQLLGPHDAVALGVFVNRRLFGFCFGGVFRGSTSGFLNSNWAYLLWRVLTHPWLATNPEFRKRAGVGARLLQRTKPPGLPASQKLASTDRSFGILSIAVHPQSQGLGLGRVLMKESETAARQRGFDQMDLTVHPNNHQAIQFYKILGWEKAGQQDVWQGKMRKSLLAPNGQSSSSVVTRIEDAYTIR
jgi:ribosomal protein S18 acetylase RimI-like enzyme